MKLVFTTQMKCAVVLCIRFACVCIASIRGVTTAVSDQTRGAV